MVNPAAITTWLFDEGIVVTYSWLSTELGVPAEAAKQALEKYVAESRSALVVQYYVSGFLLDGKFAVRIVPAADVEATRALYRQVLSCVIYSVQAQERKDVTTDVYNLSARQLAKVLAGTSEASERFRLNQLSRVRCSAVSLNPARRIFKSNSAPMSAGPASMMGSTSSGAGGLKRSSAVRPQEAGFFGAKPAAAPAPAPAPAPASAPTAATAPLGSSASAPPKTAPGAKPKGVSSFFGASAAAKPAAGGAKASPAAGSSSSSPATGAKAAESAAKAMDSSDSESDVDMGGDVVLDSDDEDVAPVRLARKTPVNRSRRVVSDEEDDDDDASTTAGDESAAAATTAPPAAGAAGDSEAQPEDDVDMNEPPAPEPQYKPMETFFASSAPPVGTTPGMVRRKVWVEKTFVDEDGYTVTKRVEEEVEVPINDVAPAQAPVAAPAPASAAAPTLVASASVSSSTDSKAKAESKPAASASGAKAGAKPKQASISNFFSKR